MKGWLEHKDECKKTRDEYKTVKLSENPLFEVMAREEGLAKEDIYEGVMSFTNGIKPGRKASAKKKSHFVVKVQVAVMDAVNGSMYVYNQDRSLQGHLVRSGNETVHQELSQQIRSKGFRGLKGYFRAILETKA